MGSYMIMPCVLVVVDDGCTKTSGRVDAGAGDRNGSQVHQEHGESDG